MTTLAEPVSPSASQQFLLDRISWQGYEMSATSVCFPGLVLGEMERFVRMAASLDTTSIRMAFRDWVRTRE